MIADYVVTALSFAKRKEKRKLIQQALRFWNKKGIEIGGPSDLFRLKGQLPIYPFAARVDGVNFSNDTLWEGQLKTGENYHYYKGHTGYQYIAEASDLDFIEEGKYDFLLSCHSLEHVANPLKAILGWKRILCTGGRLVLVLPDKEFTFDNKRPYTRFTHILADFEQQTGEDDTTHFQEVLDLHDFTRDGVLGSLDELKTRTFNNLTNRAIHHHVFSLELVKELLEYAGFNIEHQQKAKPFHLVTIASKKS